MESMTSTEAVASIWYPYSIVRMASESMSPNIPSCVTQRYCVGADDGLEVGCIDGVEEGLADGFAVGNAEGVRDGERDGCEVGDFVGNAESV